MPLRLYNARALPTCPQKQRTKKTLKPKTDPSDPMTFRSLPNGISARDRYREDE
jgi:hypothetical protein